jgi:hypothetical protein
MRKNTTNPIILLRITVENICQNPIILYPTFILGLIQLLILEILYFAPRHPLANFFGPLISRIWSEDFLHYPMDLVLLPKLFYYAQIFVYLFFGGFLLAITANIVATINRNHRPHLKQAFRTSSHYYVHIFCSSLISLILFQLFSTSYTAVVNAILRIKSPNLVVIKFQKIFLLATPYIQFLIGILITTLLVYVIPIIIIEKKRIVEALVLNLNILFKSFGTSFLVVFIPTIFYLPILVARNNIESIINWTLPEVQIFIIMFGVLVTMLIDLVILTTITTHYLFLKKE